MVDVTREVDAELAAVLAPLERKLREIETLQQHHRREADKLEEPKRRLRKIIEASKPPKTGGARPPHGPAGTNRRAGVEAIAA